MKRSDVDRVKAQAKELLHRIDQMERCAGWVNVVTHGQANPTKPCPGDRFSAGQFTASVKRASMDLTRSLVDLRRG